VTGHGAVRPPTTPFGRTVWLVLRKDLTVEMRSGEIAYTTLFFAVSCVLIFAFALVREGRAPEGGAAGILWIAILFAGTLALGRAFERERQSETLRALLLAPVPRPAVYVGKLLGIVALLVATEAVLLPLVGLLFTAPFFAHPFWLAGIVVTCTIGLAAVGTLFAAMLVRVRSRDMLLPVLLYPVVVPVIIAGVQGTAALLQPEFDAAVVRFWLLLLVTFDVVFVVLALWTFEAVMSD
jgi:heme exporter protein CcmB